MTSQIKKKQPSDASSPYDKLYIYYLNGKLASTQESFGDSFIGNWEEGDTSFLFFSESVEDRIDALLAGQPHLTLKDRFCMPYDQWHGEAVNPFRVGRLLIMPPWEKVDPDKKDVPIVIDPGVVFGAGTHRTTRDCLEAIEMVCHDNLIQSALDLGTGTGLLAIAAAGLGVPQTLAVDNNFLAAKTALKNVILNGFQDRIGVVCADAEDLVDRPADLLVANIHYDVMQKLVVRPGFLLKKRVVLSGLLRSEASEIEARLSELPVTVIKRWIKDGIWHTICARIDS